MSRPIVEIPHGLTLRAASARYVRATFERSTSATETCRELGISYHTFRKYNDDYDHLKFEDAELRQQRTRQISRDTTIINSKGSHAQNKNKTD